LPPPPPPVEAPPAPAQTAPAVVAAPAQDGPADAEDPDLGEKIERKPENSEENTKNDAIYEEKVYIKDSSEIISSQTKSRLKEIFPTVAAFVGAALAIMAGLCGLHFHRKRRKGAGKDGDEKKR
jgi:hypothetical protein